MPPSPKEVVQSWFNDAWNTGDEGAIDRLMAPSAEFHGLSSVEAQPIVGPQSFKPLFRSFRLAFPDLRINIDRVLCEGDLVAVHLHITGTHLGDGLGIAPTSVPIDFWGMVIAQVRDGQIQEGWNSFDFMSLYQQVGLLPSLGSQPQ